MGAPKPQLPEPIVVDQWWCNRRHDAIVTTLQSYEGHLLVDLRKHAMGRDGKLKRTQKGVTFKLTRLCDLAKSVDRAITKARELGLLDGDAE